LKPSIWPGGGKLKLIVILGLLVWFGASCILSPFRPHGDLEGRPGRLYCTLLADRSVRPTCKVEVPTTSTSSGTRCRESPSIETSIHDLRFCAVSLQEVCDFLVLGGGIAVGRGPEGLA
jgi:hypothetical protein